MAAKADVYVVRGCDARIGDIAQRLTQYVWRIDFREESSSSAAQVDHVFTSTGTSFSVWLTIFWTTFLASK